MNDQEKKGCVGCLAVVIIIVIALVLCRACSKDECIQIDGQWYCGPEADTQRIKSMNSNDQTKAKQDIDRREAEENRNKSPK